MPACNDNVLNDNDSVLRDSFHSSSSGVYLYFLLKIGCPVL